MLATASTENWRISYNEDSGWWWLAGVVGGGVRRSYTSNESPDHSCKLAKTKLVLSSVSVWQHDPVFSPPQQVDFFSKKRFPPPFLCPSPRARRLGAMGGKVDKNLRLVASSVQKRKPELWRRAIGGLRESSERLQQLYCHGIDEQCQPCWRDLCQSSWKKVENNQQVSENTLWLSYLSSVNR